MTDPDRPVSDDPEDGTVWLADRPVDRAALEDAQRMLANFDDIELPHPHETPRWVTAARLAVREALSDDHARQEAEDE